MEEKCLQIRIFDQHSGYRTIFENLGIVGIIIVLRHCREYYQINMCSKFVFWELKWQNLIN